MSLQKIQERLRAPKNQFNDFGKYKYRSQEDILEAVKPLLAEFSYALVLSDEVIEVGGRVYIEARATIYNDAGDIVAQNMACAREPESKKGMDDAQLTGATSSYARKYALNGLFAIDDTKDADSMDNTRKEYKPKPEPKVSEEQLANISALASEVSADYEKMCAYFGASDLEDIKASDYDAVIRMLEKKRTA